MLDSGRLKALAAGCLVLFAVIGPAEPMGASSRVACFDAEAPPMALAGFAG